MSDLQTQIPERESGPLKPKDSSGNWDLSSALSELAGPPAAGAAKSEGLGTFLHSLRRQWLPGVGLGMLVASIVAAVLWFVIPANFEAVAVLQVGRRPTLGMQQAYFNPDAVKEYKMNQQAMLRSYEVIKTALSNPGISQLKMVRFDRMGSKREDPADWLVSALSVGYANESSMLRVSLRGEDPAEIKKIVQAVVDGYLSGPVAAEAKQRKDDLLLIDKTITDENQKLNKLTQDMKALQFTFTPNSTVMNAKLELYQRQLADLMMQKQEFQRQRDMAVQEAGMLELVLKNRRVNPRPWMVDDVLKESSPRFAALAEEVDFLQQQIAQVESQGDGGPAGTDLLHNQLDEKNFELDTLRRQLQREAMERLETTTFPTTREQDNIQLQLRTSQITYLEERIKEADEAFTKLQSQMDTFNDGSLELQNLSNELAEVRRNLSELQRQRQEMEMRNQSMEQSEIREIQKAMVPEVNNFWMKAAQVFGGALLSLVGVVALVAYTDFIMRRVNTLDEVEGIDRIDVIATLPQLTASGAAALLPASAKGRRIREKGLARAVDSLRTLLACQRSGSGHAMFLITSSGAQEGKTMLASQLAASFAKSGRRTLLIDADLHNPDLHALVGVPMGAGFCEVLRKQAALSDVVQPLAVENLWFLQAGVRDEVIDTLLSLPATAELFKQLRKSYDCVIVDGGPVLSGPDSLLLGQYVDTAILSVRQDVSRRDKVRDACNRLKAIGCNIAGIVYSGGKVELRGNERVVTATASTKPRIEGPTQL